MTTDYDAPRVRVENDTTTDYLAQLETRRSHAAAATLTIDDDDTSMPGDMAVLDRPGLSGDDLTFTVVAQQPDEFTCSCCFLVQHHSRRTRTKNDQRICRDCT